MLNCKSRDPNVVFGYRMPFNSQVVFHFAVNASGFNVVSQNDIAGSELVNPRDVLLYANGFMSAVKQFADDHTWNENLIGDGKFIFYRRFVGKERNDNIGIQQIFTIHFYPPVRNLA